MLCNTSSEIQQLLQISPTASYLHYIYALTKSVANLTTEIKNNRVDRNVPDGLAPKRCERLKISTTVGHVGRYIPSNFVPDGEEQGNFEIFEGVANRFIKYNT